MNSGSPDRLFLFVFAAIPNAKPLRTFAGIALARRVHEHKQGLIPGLTSRYGCKRLVWYEEHFDVRDAIDREKAIKRWPRKWKAELIEAIDPRWSELYRGVGW